MLSVAQEVADAGVGRVYVDDDVYSQRTRLRANPASAFEDEFGTADYALGLMEAARCNASEKTTLLQYMQSDTKMRWQSATKMWRVHIDVATANLAVFYPSSAKMLPASVLKEFEKERNVTPEFVDGLNPQDRAALSSAARMFTDALLRGNTKLEQSKVPSVLGIGTPSDIKGYNFAPTSGAKGLSLMNAASLVGGEKLTELESFRDIVVGVGTLDQGTPLSAVVRRS